MRRTPIFVFTIALLALCTSFTAKSQNTPPFLAYVNSPWVDSVMNTLSPDERIAQLFVSAVYANRNEAYDDAMLKLIHDYKIGGILCMQGSPSGEVGMINRCQEVAKIPLLVAIDAEWGLAMRVDSTISFPYQMGLGAIQNDSLIYQMGQEVARQLHRLGAQSNFSPVIDVNNNPANPVINYRSFGEDKHNVARKAVAYMTGMQDKMIFTTVKHFPGHGDTNTDSHHALPIIRHSRAHLDSIELYPFRELIKAGASGIMVAHLDIPSLDSSRVPSTLSKTIISGLLRDEMGFQGLIVSDAMNMEGVAAGHEPGVVDKDALLAGNDLLEFSKDIPRAISEVRKAVKNGLITQKDIDARCRKVLALKQWAGLSNYQPTPVNNLLEDLNCPSANLLNRKLTEATLTVLNNEDNLLPLQRLDTLHIASVSFGADSTTSFQQTLGLYTAITNFSLPNEATSAQVDSLRKKLKNYNMVIAALHDHSIRPHNKVILSESGQSLLSEIAARSNSVLVVFKNAYVINDLAGTENAKGLVLTYQDTPLHESVAAQLIFGGISANGRLPVSIGTKYAAGHGLVVKGGIRFSYTLPEAAGMDSKSLTHDVDSLVFQALKAHATPGCQILVAKDQKVVFHKAYGLQDYSDTVQVKLDDLYDLASVTKISTSMAAMMKLYDAKAYSLDNSLGDFLPKFNHSNKSDIPLRDILTHQAGFVAWIAFWKETQKGDHRYKKSAIHPDSSKRFPIKLTNTMYLNRRYPNKIVAGIRKSPLSGEKKYVYSDFFFILAPRVVKSMAQTGFVTYLQKNFYDPLGATTVTFNPLEKYPQQRIIPTEHDYEFRHEAVHGTVHDENAAMMNGVSGHAGLFANANDLAKLMQMYLNMGEYGGERYISTSTLREFTRAQFPENNNRRALGFDKPALVYTGVNSNTAKDASKDSFGHTGFTGIFVWMDPQTNLLYIFLSNRVDPTRDNKRLYQLNTRTMIQQALYDAIKK